MEQGGLPDYPNGTNYPDWALDYSRWGGMANGLLLSMVLASVVFGAGASKTVGELLSLDQRLAGLLFALALNTFAGVSFYITSVFVKPYYRGCEFAMSLGEEEARRRAESGRRDLFNYTLLFVLLRGIRWLFRRIS